MEHILWVPVIFYLGAFWERECFAPNRRTTAEMNCRCGAYTKDSGR